MSDYPKKIHECFKRTLLFGSGKKIKPVVFCFGNNTFLDSNICNGAIEASPEDEREYRERFVYYPNGSRCASCPFLKSSEYTSDALKVLKICGAMCFQEVGNERRKDIFTSLCRDGFLVPLLDRVKARCYLTFNDSDRRMIYDKIMRMNFEQMFTLIEKIDAFCKENNIK